MIQITLPLAPASPSARPDEPRAVPTPPSVAPVDVAPGTRPRPPGGAVRLIDPQLVKPEGLNPRDFAKLDLEACGQLLEMIETVGQLVPVLVRPLGGDPRYRYQLIAGARRLWSVRELVRRGKPLELKAEIIDVDDREAARIAEAENRGRAPISAYEHGLFLRHRLAAYPSQAALAEDMKLEAGLLSRLLSLADWPDEMLDAFGDRRLITVEDVVVLNKHLDNDATRDVLLAEAQALAAEQKRRAGDGYVWHRRTEVRRRLVEAVAPGAARERVTDAKGALVLVINRPTRNGVSLFVPESDAARRGRIVAAIRAAALKAAQR